MARCLETMPWHGDTLRCEVDGDHDKAPGDNGGEVDIHFVTLIAPDDHQGNLTDGSPPDGGKPYIHKWYDPTTG